MGETRVWELIECPVCNAPLKSLVVLNKKDVRLDLGDIPGNELRLLVCPAHFLRKLHYTITSAGEFLHSTRSPDTEVEMDSHLSIVLPEPQQILLHAIPDRIAETRELAGEGRLLEAADWARKFDWHQPRNQVGGFPVLVNRRLNAPHCSLCESRMPFLASVVVDIRSPIEPDIHVLQMLFFLCRGCSNVASIPDTGADLYS